MNLLKPFDIFGIQSGEEQELEQRRREEKDKFKRKRKERKREEKRQAYQNRKRIQLDNYGKYYGLDHLTAKEGEGLSSRELISTSGVRAGESEVAELEPQGLISRGFALGQHNGRYREQSGKVIPGVPTAPGTVLSEERFGVVKSQGSASASGHTKPLKRF